MRTAVDAVTQLPMSIPSPDWSGFNIGPLTIHAYALCILAGIAAALWLTSVRWQRRGGPEDAIWDIAIWAVPFGIIGGRLYHVFSSPDAYFGEDGNLWLIPQIWLGGLGIWGAVVLGVVGAWIGCRRSGVKLTAFMDAAAPGLLLAQAIGRWGNWFNQELYGGPTTVPWGLEIDADNPDFPAGLPADTLFHPTFLYESLWNLAGVALLLLLDRRFKFRLGRLFWLYAAYYTLGRVWIEAMRIDDAELIFGVRLNVWTSIIVFVVAVIVFIVLGRRMKDSGVSHSVYLPGREPKPETDESGAETSEPEGTVDAGSGDKDAADAHAATDASDKSPQGSNVDDEGSTEHDGHAKVSDTRSDAQDTSTLDHPNERNL